MKRSAAPRPSPGRTPPPAVVGAIGAALLVLHVALLLWVSARNSVTFDESFHVPAGVRIVTAGDFVTSWAQPPLPKALYGAAALAAGARPPDPAACGPGRERFAGYSFMRENADRFARVYAAARLPAVAVALALALLVWRAAAAGSGPLGGLFALALWTASPEALAHGALAGVDLPTALVFFGASLAFAAFARGGGVRRWLVCAAWVALAFVTRFSAVQLFAIFPTMLLALAWAGRLRRPAGAWLGLLALLPVALVAVNAGYGFQGTLTPLGRLELHAPSSLALQRALPALPLPVPVAWAQGVDYLAFLARAGQKASYALGQVRWASAWWYFPLALAVKWPLGLLVLLVLRALRPAEGARARARDVILLVPPAVIVAFAIGSGLDFGVRYVLPALPFLCVWCAGLVRGARPRARAGPWPALAAAGLLLVAGESARALPHPLAFFNVLARGHGDRIVNDSNVDWGQGLVALRDDLRRLGIGRVHLAYHGTVDPALYGIDGVPYTGGMPGGESDFLAVSSYFFVGLPARLTTSRGMSEQPVRLDLSPLWTATPVAVSGGSIYVFRIR